MRVCLFFYQMNSRQWNCQAGLVKCPCNTVHVPVGLVPQAAPPLATKETPLPLAGPAQGLGEPWVLAAVSPQLCRDAAVRIPLSCLSSPQTPVRLSVGRKGAFVQEAELSSVTEVAARVPLS